MKITFEKFFLLFKIVIIAAMALFFCFLVVKKLAIGGVGYETEFNAPSKFIQGFYPEGRVEQLVGIQKIDNEPVYLEVYSPGKFSTAKVQLRYKNAARLPARFGVKLNGADWAFYLVDLAGASNDFVEQSFEFDLSMAERKNNKIKFMLASPLVGDSQEKIYIDKFSVEYVW
ncbi:hypothetical protein HZB94_00370 [Candidatus Falkowbacteria bacterium]|nr:hypothetical protein [Candidatus Falkowbacteria bacterium]